MFSLKFIELQLIQLCEPINNPDELETDTVYNLGNSINKIQGHLEEIQKVTVFKFTNSDEDQQNE